MSRVKVGVGFWRSSLALKREEEEEGRRQGSQGFSHDFSGFSRMCFLSLIACSLVARAQARPPAGRSVPVGRRKSPVCRLVQSARQKTAELTNVQPLCYFVASATVQVDLRAERDGCDCSGVITPRGKELNRSHCFPLVPQLPVLSSGREVVFDRFQNLEVRFD